MSLVPEPSRTPEVIQSSALRDPQCAAGSRLAVRGGQEQGGREGHSLMGMKVEPILGSGGNWVSSLIVTEAHIPHPAAPCGPRNSPRANCCSPI